MPADAASGRSTAGSLGPGQRFGGHRIVRLLATGGMAELYLARAAGPAGFDHVVALKRVLPHLAADAELVGMFLDEARLAATLRHQNIAQIHAFGRDGGAYFYTMEYLHGADLARVLRRLAAGEAAVDAAAVVAIGIAAAAGLHHAHEQRDAAGRHLGLVHRDVSPANLIVTYDGAVKLVDFGIAKAAGQRTVTATGVLKGKVAYLAPEQCEGASADRRADVYALGVTLFELSTGRRLFHGEHEVAVMRRIIAGDVPDPTTLVPGYPPALAAILARAIAVDPARRYQSALELGVALEELARDAGYATGPRELAAWLRRTVGEPDDLALDRAPGARAWRRWWVAGGATAVAIAGAAIAVLALRTGAPAGALRADGDAALAPAPPAAVAPTAVAPAAVAPAGEPAPPPVRDGAMSREVAPAVGSAGEAPPPVRDARHRSRRRDRAGERPTAGSAWTKDSPILPGVQ